MKRYMLLPEDSIEILPEDGEAESAVSVFCERTLIVFPCSKIETLSFVKNVTIDRRRPEDCMQIVARDALFDARQALLIPATRPDYASFTAALRALCPALFESFREQEYTPETCDQTGSHLHRHE